jgi:uncharacterized membrane protein YvbJ
MRRRKYHPCAMCGKNECSEGYRYCYRCGGKITSHFNHEYYATLAALHVKATKREQVSCL